MHTKEELDKKTESKLVDLAKAEFGIDAAPNMTKADIVAAILQAQEDDAAPAGFEEAELEAEEAPRAPAKKYRLIVHNQEGVDSSPFLKVGINGNHYQITREKEVVVPESVIAVLKDAVIEKFEPVAGGGVDITQVRRIPFSVLGEAA